MTARTTSSWEAVTASVRGASHERTGLPNQDAVVAVEVEGGIVAAVADGHGGARYVRSDVGSRFGAELACELGAAVLRRLSGAGTAQVRRELAGPLVNDVVARWSDAVLAHLAAHPFTEEERTRAGQPIDDQPLVAYGCTLVLALAGPRWVGLVQIGDGDATVVRDGVVEAPVPGDDRLVGGETTSLCLPTATADARVAVVDGVAPELVVLTSDGYANSFAAPDWRERAGLDLLRQVRGDGIQDVAQRLPAWLADSAVAGGDDVSMALLHRTTTGATVPAASPPMAAAAPARRGGGMAVAAAAVALVAGGLGGWFLAGGGDDEPVTPSTTTTSSSSTSTTSTTVPLGTASIALPSLGSTEIVGFDPVPGSATPRVVARVAPLASRSDLPSPWTLTNGQLRRGQKSVAPAVVATRVGDHVWAISADRSRLLAFELATGQPAGDGELIDRTSGDGDITQNAVGGGTGDTGEPDGE